MKKTITIILIALCVLLSVAQAETLYTLDEVQEIIMKNSPLKLMQSQDVEVELSGTVAEITDPQSGRILYRIEAEGDGVNAPLFGYDVPCFIAASNDTANIGDKVTVTGTVNFIYSSHAIPFIGRASISVE